MFNYAETTIGESLSIRRTFITKMWAEFTKLTTC